MYNIIERNGRKFGSRGPVYCMCRELFMSHSLSSVWGHSVHYAKCSMLRFSNGYCSHSFHSISTKPEKVWNSGKYSPMHVLFQVICQILSIWHFEEKLPQPPVHAIIHKPILVSCGKRSRRGSRPLGLLLVINSGPNNSWGGALNLQSGHRQYALHVHLQIHCTCTSINNHYRFMLHVPTCILLFVCMAQLNYRRVLQQIEGLHCQSRQKKDVPVPQYIIFSIMLFWKQVLCLRPLTSFFF